MADVIDRANTPKQKREVVERLYALWSEYPELRLGQLIGNVYSYPLAQDPYFDGDMKFITKLERFYNG